MTDYEDYENNLAFPPTTDRTQSNDELVDKIEKLEKKLEIAIATLELYALEKMRLRTKDGTEYELENIGYCRAKDALMKIKGLEK